MKTIELPFNATQGGINNPKPDKPNYLLARPLMEFNAGAYTSNISAVVSVIFDVPVGSGKVILLLTNMEGDQVETLFEQNGSSRAIVVPLFSSGVQLYHASPRSKGKVVITITANN